MFNILFTFLVFLTCIGVISWVYSKNLEKKHIENFTNSSTAESMSSMLMQPSTYNMEDVRALQEQITDKRSSITSYVDAIEDLRENITGLLETKREFLEKNAKLNNEIKEIQKRVDELSNHIRENYVQTEKHGNIDYFNLVAVSEAHTLLNTKIENLQTRLDNLLHQNRHKRNKRQSVQAIESIAQEIETIKAHYNTRINNLQGMHTLLNHCKNVQNGSSAPGFESYGPELKELCQNVNTDVNLLESNFDGLAEDDLRLAAQICESRTGECYIKSGTGANATCTKNTTSFNFHIDKWPQESCEEEIPDNCSKSFEDTCACDGQTSDCFYLNDSNNSQYYSNQFQHVMKENNDNPNLYECALDYSETCYTENVKKEEAIEYCYSDKVGGAVRYPCYEISSDNKAVPTGGHSKDWKPTKIGKYTGECILNSPCRTKDDVQKELDCLTDNPVCYKYNSSTNKVGPDIVGSQPNNYGKFKYYYNHETMECSDPRNPCLTPEEVCSNRTVPCYDDNNIVTNRSMVYDHNTQECKPPSENCSLIPYCQYREQISELDCANGSDYGDKYKWWQESIDGNTWTDSLGGGNGQCFPDESKLIPNKDNPTTLTAKTNEYICECQDDNYALRYFTDGEGYSDNNENGYTSIEELRNNACTSKAIYTGDKCKTYDIYQAEVKQSGCSGSNLRNKSMVSDSKLHCDSDCESRCENDTNGALIQCYEPTTNKLINKYIYTSSGNNQQQKKQNIISANNRPNDDICNTNICSDNEYPECSFRDNGLDFNQQNIDNGTWTKDGELRINNDLCPSDIDTDSSLNDISKKGIQMYKATQSFIDDGQCVPPNPPNKEYTDSREEESTSEYCSQGCIDQANPTVCQNKIQEDGTNINYMTYELLRPAKHGGNEICTVSGLSQSSLYGVNPDVGTTKEIQGDCPDPIDCVGHFDYDTCTHDGSAQFIITTPAQYNGLACEYTCNQVVPNVDGCCVLNNDDHYEWKYYEGDTDDTLLTDISNDTWNDNTYQCSTEISQVSRKRVRKENADCKGGQDGPPETKNCATYEYEYKYNGGEPIIDSSKWENDPLPCYTDENKSNMIRQLKKTNDSELGPEYKGNQESKQLDRCCNPDDYNNSFTYYSDNEYINPLPDNQQDLNQIPCGKIVYQQKNKKDVECQGLNYFERGPTTGTMECCDSVLYNNDNYVYLQNNNTPTDQTIINNLDTYDPGCGGSVYKTKFKICYENGSNIRQYDAIETHRQEPPCCDDVQYEYRFDKRSGINGPQTIAGNTFNSANMDYCESRYIMQKKPQQRCRIKDTSTYIDTNADSWQDVPESTVSGPSSCYPDCSGVQFSTWYKYDDETRDPISDTETRIDCGEVLTKYKKYNQTCQGLDGIKKQNELYIIDCENDNKCKSEPCPPVINHCEATGRTSIEISWSPGKNGAFIALGYTFEIFLYKQNGSQKLYSFEVYETTETNNKFVLDENNFNDISNNTTYTFKITKHTNYSQNHSLTSEFSNNVTTLYNKAGPPSQIRVDQTHNSLNVIWTQGNNGDETIENFMITLYKNTNVFKSQIYIDYISDQEYSHSFNNLDPNTNYDIHIYKNTNISPNVDGWDPSKTLVISTSTTAIQCSEVESITYKFNKQTKSVINEISCGDECGTINVSKIFSYSEPCIGTKNSNTTETKQCPACIEYPTKPSIISIDQIPNTSSLKIIWLPNSNGTFPDTNIWYSIIFEDLNSEHVENEKPNNDQYCGPTDDDGKCRSRWNHIKANGSGQQIFIYERTNDYFYLEENTEYQFSIVKHSNYNTNQQVYRWGGTNRSYLQNDTSKLGYSNSMSKITGFKRSTNIYFSRTISYINTGFATLVRYIKTGTDQIQSFHITKRRQNTDWGNLPNYNDQFVRAGNSSHDIDFLRGFIVTHYSDVKRKMFFKGLYKRQNNSDTELNQNDVTTMLNHGYNYMTFSSYNVDGTHNNSGDYGTIFITNERITEEIVNGHKTALDNKFQIYYFIKFSKTIDTDGVVTSEMFE